MAVEELLDLTRVDVLPAPDHHVLDPAGDVQVARVVDDGEVAGVHPPGRVDGGTGLRLVVPVAEHHRVPPGAQFPGRTAGYDLAGLRVDDLDFDVRVHPAHGRHAPFHIVVRARLGGHRGRLGHPVTNGHLGHV